MALRDYILCSKCECKLIYDGHDIIRDQWEEKHGSKINIECPDCKEEMLHEWPESVMRAWDHFRKEIANGDVGSMPRDWFESLPEQFKIYKNEDL